MHNLYFLYSSDSGTVLCGSTEEELKNEKEVCAATCTAVEGMYHMPFSNLCISTNFGIGKCEGMGGEGGEGGDEWRLIESRKLRKRREYGSTAIRLCSHIV